MTSRADLSLIALRAACVGLLACVVILGRPHLHAAWRVVPLAVLLVLQVVTAVRSPAARGPALRAEMRGASVMAIAIAGQVLLRPYPVERVGTLTGSVLQLVFFLGLLAGAGGLAAGAYAAWQRHRQ